MMPSAFSSASRGPRNKSLTAFTAWLSGPVMVVRCSSSIASLPLMAVSSSAPRA